MRLRGRSSKEAAARFIVQLNTVRNCNRALRDKLRTEDVVGAPPWNRFHGGVRWLVHEIRQLCPARDFGTRIIARHIMRSGILISRMPVHRFLQEEPQPRQHGDAPPNLTNSTAPAHLIRPRNPHHVCYLDITSIRVLWLKLEVAAIIDGCNRKIIGIREFATRPTTEDMVKLIEDSIRTHSTPRFVDMDRGSQFERMFYAAMMQRSITHARCPARDWQFNAKVERLFWSLKRWWRVSLVPPNLTTIQKRLNDFAVWYNLYHPHTSLGMLTPSEAEFGSRRPEPMRYTEGGVLEPQITNKRHHVGDDPRLMYPVIKVEPRHRSEA